MKEIFGDIRFLKILLLVICVSFGCSIAAQEVFLKEFMNSMKNGDDLNDYLLFPSQFDEPFINFVFVDEFKIESEEKGASTWTVLVDTGQGHFSMKLTFLVQYNETQKRWLVVANCPEERYYQERPVVIPWISKEKL